MKDIKMALRETILEILGAELDPYGVPLVAAVKQTRDCVGDMDFSVTDREIEDTIQEMLDSWQVDKVVSPLLEDDERRFGLPLGLPAWHLRPLTSSTSIGPWMTKTRQSLDCSGSRTIPNVLARSRSKKGEGY